MDSDDGRPSQYGRDLLTQASSHFLMRYDVGIRWGYLGRVRVGPPRLPSLVDRGGDYFPRRRIFLLTKIWQYYKFEQIW